MIILRNLSLRVIVLCVVSLCLIHTAFAQSTVFNIPSTDVLARHQGYFEADFMAHMTSYENGGYHSYGARVVHGLGKRTEVGLNMFYTRTEPAEPVELQPNFKWRFFDNEERGLGVAAGLVAFIPVTHRSTNNTRAMVYAVASKNLKGSFGPRFTAGGYSLIGHMEQSTTRSGVLLGYEQPLSSKLTFIADWSSGNNDLGYVSAGAGITLTQKTTLYIGYNVGNHGRGNNSLGVYYGISF